MEALCRYALRAEEDGSTLAECATLYKGVAHNLSQADTFRILAYATVIYVEGV
jgi:hypothetical protein